MKITVDYALDAAYRNQSELGPSFCNAGGSETADFGLRFHYKPVTLRLAFGSQVFARGSQFPTEDSWAESGTQDLDPSGEGILCPPDFANPKPLHCTGGVGVLQDPRPAPPTILVGIVRGQVVLAASTGGDLGELAQASCGEQDTAAIPYLGLEKALAPYDGVQTRVRLATFAKHPARTLPARPQDVPAGYDPAHCDGAADKASGQSCTATLTVHAVTLRITVTR